MTLIERADGRGWQEARPSCCMNGHPWTRAGAYSILGHHARSWQCSTCGDVVRYERP